MTTNGEYEIEDGIPMPPIRGKGLGLKGAVSRLEVGQSILAIGHSNGTVCATGRNVAKTAPGRKFTSRKVEGGIRVWRIA